MLPQIAVGILGTKFGIKNLILVAVFINSLCMFIIPTIAVHFGSQGVMVCRILQGIAQGFMVPSIHGAIGKWALPKERCRVYAFISTGKIKYNIFSSFLTLYTLHTSLNYYPFTSLCNKMCKIFTVKTFNIIFT